MKEDLRIKALKKINQFDTASEPLFDEVTRLASIICDVPISLISLLDDTRLYFKSNFGLEDLSETSVEFSFCKKTITLNEKYYEVLDLESVPEFASNPLVKGYPYIKYYIGVPIKDKNGKILGTICVVDNKKRVMSAHQKECLMLLARHTERLFELKEQTVNMNRLNDRLIILSDRLSHFSAIAAHDLKEPLRIIKSFTMLLHKKNLTHWDDKDLSYMHFVIDGARRLENYIEGLLNYTKNLGTNDSYQSFDFTTLVNEIIECLQQSNSNKNIIFNAKIELTSNMKLPKAAIYSICQNILDNSFKFSSTISRPMVELTVFEDRNNYFFSIIDNGIGIIEDKINEVIQPFVRLNSRKEFDGLGLGLSIVDSQIQFLNGQLQIESTVLKGTKVNIQIPKLN